MGACQRAQRVVGFAHGQPVGGAAGALYHPRGMIMFNSVAAGKDPETNRTARALFTDLVKVAAENDWAPYRVHPIWQKQAVEVYRYNDHILHRLHETLKDAIDPAGILSPGRYDIWPKRLRGDRA